MPAAFRLTSHCLLLVLVVTLAAPLPTVAGTLARCGEGFLEEVDGYRVLHIKGTAYEMGYQHGALLKEHIRESMRYLFEVKAKEKKLQFLGLEIRPKDLIAKIAAHERKFIPERFMRELEGVADGAECELEDVVMANFIPELFHCSGFAMMNSATRDGTLYHGRILDYSTDWKLQEHAVLVVAEGEGRIPLVNVTYAGFIGSVTGMNAEHVSVGEMGGRGFGHWDGVPMSLLVRRVLEEADTLDEAVAVFRDNPRTCEYYYVVADGDENRAVGLAAHWNKFEIVEPGAAHPRLPEPTDDTVLLSAGSRYTELARRVREGKGTFDAAGALRLMDCPVAMKSNLHSVLFEPRSTRLWVANASPDGQPAATQKYFKFQLTELLGHEADAKATEIAPRSR
ncbi:MAG TPA: C45 family peptidase [Pirellulales bacterium]|nr:C45 family peptidase [Pirellulales bacterium]